MVGGQNGSILVRITPDSDLRLIAELDCYNRGSHVSINPTIN